MNLYDYGKQIMSAETPMDPIIFHSKIKELADNFIKPNKYYMLLCHERRDYTILNVKRKERDIQSIEEMIMNRGLVLTIDKQPDGNYEIWIRDFHTNENFVYYLFDYTEGVMEV